MRKKGAQSFRNAIRDTLFLYALIPVLGIIIITIVIVSITWYYVSWRQVKNYHQEICKALEETVGNMAGCLEELAKNEDLAAGLAEKRLSGELYGELYAMLGAGRFRGDFFVLDDAFHCISGSRTIYPDYFENGFSSSRRIRKEMESGAGVCMEWEDEGMGGQPSYVLACSVLSGNKTMGYLVVDISQEEFFNGLKDFGAEMFVANSYGHVYWDTGAQMADNLGKLPDEVRHAGKFLMLDGQYYQICVSEPLNWQLIVYIVKDITDLVLILSTAGVVFLVLFAGLLFLNSRVSGLVADGKVEVIERICETMRKTAEEGGLYTPIVIESGDELEQIARAYNKLCEEINGLIEKNREITRLQMLAEVRRLESQFNPHFIFNTLETIKVLTAMEPEKAQKAITSLAKLLRYSISDSLGYVTLAEDIRYTEDYLFLQKMRFQKKLEYQIEQEEGVDNKIVPRLIFQPLVENAIQYGKDENGYCRIKICVAAENNSLRIQVMDRGMAVSDEKIKEIRELLGQEQNNSVHIGLYQLHKRVQLIYGREYGLTFWKREKGGMCFQLTLPMIEEGSESVPGVDCGG